MAGKQKPLESTINGTKVIEDLGCIGKSSARFAIFECKYCSSHFKSRVANVKQGICTSCGCYGKEARRKSVTKHSQSRTRLYRTWAHMIDRCYRPNCKAYSNYGAKGVTVCDEWKTFEAFYAWAKTSGYEETLQLDKDVIGNGKIYSPETCKWVTHMENSQGDNKNNLKLGNSGFRNVSIDKRKKNKKFFGQKNIYGKRVVTSYYETAEEAYNALQQQLANEIQGVNDEHHME